MAVHRKAQTCPECGEEIGANYGRHNTGFIGDTFISWDYIGHAQNCNKRKAESKDEREILGPEI